MLDVVKNAIYSIHTLLECRSRIVYTSAPSEHSEAFLRAVPSITRAWTEDVLGQLSGAYSAADQNGNACLMSICFKDAKQAAEAMQQPALVQWVTQCEAASTRYFAATKECPGIFLSHREDIWRMLSHVLDGVHEESAA